MHLVGLQVVQQVVHQRVDNICAEAVQGAEALRRVTRVLPRAQLQLDASAAPNRHIGHQNEGRLLSLVVQAAA